MSSSASTTTAEGEVRAGSLREALEIRRVRGERFSLRETIAVVVPLCTQLKSLHDQGKTFFLTPSALDHGKAGTELDLAIASGPPVHPRDRAAVAPECRRGDRGDAGASVFSIGAILYEMLTGELIGPGMKRPSEAVPGLPAQLEAILGKALVADAKHRPSDLGALAQALHHLAPAASMPPPPADESHLDHDEGFDVDVSLSMIPPPPAMPSGGERIAVDMPRGVNGGGAASRTLPTDPFAVVEAAPPPSQSHPDDPTAKLAALKQRLEADPRPRYVVIKDGMDHGPFTAVELLQQLASHVFVGADRLRDTLSNEERGIDEWEDFQPFAHQTKLVREIKKERKALEAVVEAEKRGTQYKALIGGTLVAIIAAAGIGFWARERANTVRDEQVQSDRALAVDVDAGLGPGDKARGPGGGRAMGGGSGSFPQISGGGSCEAAIAKYTEDYTQQGVPPDLSAGSYAGVLNNGSYLNACGVPSNMSVSICAAVQGGRAVGVTVVTNPSNPGIASCVSSQVRGMGFPAHPRMDVVRTTFAAQ